MNTSDRLCCLVISSLVSVLFVLNFIGIVVINTSLKYDDGVWRVSGILMICFGLLMAASLVWTLVNAILFIRRTTNIVGYSTTSYSTV